MNSVGKKVHWKSFVMASNICINHCWNTVKNTRTLITEQRKAILLNFIYSKSNFKKWVRENFNLIYWDYSIEVSDKIYWIWLWVENVQKFVFRMYFLCFNLLTNQKHRNESFKRAALFHLLKLTFYVNLNYVA